MKLKNNKMVSDLILVSGAVSYTQARQCHRDGYPSKKHAGRGT